MREQQIRQIYVVRAERFLGSRMFCMNLNKVAENNVLVILVNI